MNQFFLSPYFLLTLVPLLWSTNFILGKYFVAAIPPVTMTLGRFFVAAVVLSPWIYRAVKSGRLRDAKVVKQCLLLGISGVTLFNSLLYTGLHYTTAINSTLISAFNPLATALLSVLWLREGVARRQLLGFSLSLIGVIWIQTRGSWLNLVQFNFNPGDLFVLAATLIWAYYSVLGKIVMAKIPPLETTALTVLFGVICLIPVSAVELSSSPGILFDWKLMITLIYLGIFPSVVAFYLWLFGLSKVGVARAANFYNLVPFFGSTLAIFFLGEQPTAPQLIGGAMVLIGVFYSSTGLLPARQPEENNKAAVKTEINLQGPMAAEGEQEETGL